MNHKERGEKNREQKNNFNGSENSVSITNPWVELNLKNWLAKEGCQRAYKHIV